MKKTFFISALWVSIILVACSKFLDKKADTSISIPNRLEVLQALLDNSDVFNIALTPCISEAAATDYFIPAERYGRLTDNLERVYKWQPVEYNYNNDWAKGYAAVYTANLCLESLEKIESNRENPAQWNYIKGASLFHRAYSFLNLAWAFAKAFDGNTAGQDLGIDLRLHTDYTVPSKRSTVAETYGRIIADAKEALRYLPDTTNHVFRPSKAAGYGLLARAYLSMNQYDSAYKYAGKAMALNDFLIDYNTVGNRSLPFSGYMNANEILFYATMMTGFPVELVSPSYANARIDSGLYKLYANGDLRKQLFFATNGSYFTFKGSYATSSSRIFSGLTTAEMYLIKAECLARSNRVDDCLATLHSFLQKRWATDAFVAVSDTNPVALLDTVLAERRRELVMRGLRWSDIKRLNKEGRNIVLQRVVNNEVFTLPPNDKRYALPLPADIINLTGMPQN